MKPKLGTEERAKGEYLARISRLAARREFERKFKLKPSLWQRGGKLYALVVCCCGGWHRG